VEPDSTGSEPCKSYSRTLRTVETRNEPLSLMSHSPLRRRSVPQPRRPNGALLYFLFFCSGLSGLIYQVAWVREFGNAFGNTVYSASLIVAIFMLGLGVGSYTIWIWADRRYASQPESLLR